MRTIENPRPGAARRASESMSDAQSPDTSIRGACLCGSVAFTIAPRYRWFAHCHCSMCRKHYGSLFGTSLGVARSQFHWLEGASEIVHYRSSRAFERPFCRRCGSTVPGASDEEGYLNVPAGLLDGDLGARPRSHIFVASRSPLTTLDDALPRHDAYAPGVELPSLPNRAPLEETAVSGSCLCGGVAFTATEVPRRVVNCYCSLCRRSRAAAFSSTLLVASKAFRWARGEARVQRYELPPPRQFATDFCADCGSAVPSAPAGAPTVMLPAGAIDTPLPPLPAVHLYVGSKAPWYEIVDAWPQFEELPPPEQLTELFR
jgi:hypothetical protein